MAVRQYIGARYVPIVMGEWDNTKEYEPLSIVTYLGASYTSRQFTPVGIAITNTDYWTLTGNYNAQVETYRQQVQSVTNDVTAIQNALPISAFENDTVEDVLDGLYNILPYSYFAGEEKTVEDCLGDIWNVVGDNSSGLVKDVNDLETTVGNSSSGLVKDVNDLETTVGDNSSGLVKDVNDLETAIASISTVAAQNIILIGDSYLEGSSSGYNPTWVTKLGQSLPDSTIYNYGDRGAGFVHKGNTYNRNFLDQANAAIAAITGDDRDKVSHILIYGGVNDCANNETLSSVQNNATSLANALATAFPKAKIVACIPNASIKYLVNTDYRNLLEYAYYMRSGFRVANVQVAILDATKWLACGDSSYLSDNIHPSNALGNRIILNNVWYALFGIGELYSNYAQVTSVPSAYEGTWIESFANQLSRFKIQAGKVLIPQFFVKLTSSNYLQLMQNNLSTYLDMDNCCSLNGSKNPINLMRGTWNTGTHLYDFKAVFNWGTKHVGISCMSEDMPASLPSGTHYIYWWGLDEEIGHTST